MMIKKFTAIVVDDDLDNLNILKIYLQRYCHNIEVIGAATSIDKAISLYNDLQPEILFLDIELDNSNAFYLIDHLNNLSSQIVFVSSHEKFALKAIKYQAVDFVKKPIEINDLIAASNRAVSRILKNSNIIEKPSVKLDFLAIASTKKIELLKLSDLVYCEADGRYTNFHLSNNEKRVSCRNLGEYEALLSNNKNFFRIHHKYIINLKKIKNINKTSGNYCEFENNLSLPIAKRRQEKLIRHLNLK